MLIRATKPLFPWDELEVSPTLATIKDALRAIGRMLAERLAAPDAPKEAAHESR